MTDKYMMYPTGVVELANELKKAVNDYKARKISTSELQEIVLFWAHHSPDKLFDGIDYKLTVKKVVGLRRMSVVDKMLDGYQMPLGGV
jgi:hypothetical protein